MELFVTAVVVSHDQPEYLATTLKALAQQSVPLQQVIIVDSSNSDEPSEVAKNAGFDAPLRVSTKLGLAEILNSARAEINPESSWLWLLHDDSAPQVSALENLLRAIELSPSVAVAGPKQVEWSNPKIVMQQGLTLTRSGDLFSLVSGELDQGQHDDVDDVMAVGTAGALYRLDVFDELGGLDANAPALAADLDYSIRVRTAGHRVVVVPDAKVAHAGLSLQGERPRRWLRTSPRTAKRRAAIHLRLVYSPLLSALTYWLLLPLLGLFRAFWRILKKRPDRIWLELAGATWGFVTGPARLLSRRKAYSHAVVPFKKFLPLRASWLQVRSAARAQVEAEQTRVTLEAFERGELEGSSAVSTTGFGAGGGLWVAALLTALSFFFFPTDIAVTGQRALPLSASWLELFSKAGASYQDLGFGFYGPSDPFVWVLALVGSITFWAPSLALVLILFLAKALAFIGAWRVVALVTESAAVRILSALAFALWPSIALAQNQADLPTLFAVLSLPWFVLALARITNLGKSASAKSAAQTWSWVAIAGLLMFIGGASSPILGVFMLVVLAVVAVVRIRRIGFLVWIPAPLAAVFGPTFLFHLTHQRLLAPLAQPGLAIDSQPVGFWQLVLGGPTFGFELPLIGQFSGWAIVPVILIGLLALLQKRLATGLVISSLSVAALALAWFIQGVYFEPLGVQGSSAALTAAAGLGFATMLALALDQVRSIAARRWFAGTLAIITIVPSLVLLAATKPEIKFTDARVVPAIVAAEQQQGSQLKMLVISAETQESGQSLFRAELQDGSGLSLDDLSNNYLFALDSLESNKTAELSALVANLASANGTELALALKMAQVGYILVPASSGSAVAELAIGLNSIKELEAVGSTEFGQLWRVVNPATDLPAVDETKFWSVTKGIQFAVLLVFILLALPTGSTRKRTAGASEIFVEAGEE